MLYWFRWKPIKITFEFTNYESNAGLLLIVQHFWMKIDFVQNFKSILIYSNL